MVIFHTYVSLPEGIIIIHELGILIDRPVLHGMTFRVWNTIPITNQQHPTTGMLYIKIGELYSYTAPRKPRLSL